MQVLDALEEFYLSMEGALSFKTVIWYRQKLESLGWSLEDCTIEEVTIRILRVWRSQLSERSERFTYHPSKPVKHREELEKSLRKKKLFV